MKKERGDGNILSSLFAVISKNFKTIFRSKSSALLIIIGPLLVMTLVGMAFNNSSLFDIKVNVYSNVYSELSDQIVNQLSSSNYIVTKADSEFDCFNGVRNGDSNICLLFSDNMVITNNASNKITFYVDPSRMNIVDSITADINKEVLQKSQSISLELADTIIDQMILTKDELGNNLEFVGNIKDNEEKIKSGLTATKDSLNAIDLTLNYEDFKVLDLKNEIKSVLSKYNITNESGALNSKVDAVDLQINSAITKVKSADTKIDESAGGLNSLSVQANKNKRELDKLNSNLDDLVLGIENIVVTNPESIVKPITTEVKNVVSQRTHIGRFLPTFLVLVIMIVCILLSSSLILNEKISSAYFRNAISITPPSVFLFGAYLTTFIIVLMQIIIITVGLDFIVGYRLELLSSLVLPLFLVTSMFILLGIAIGYFTHSQEAANITSFFVISASIFFSNTILPIEAIPAYLKQIVLYNPFFVSELALKKIIVFEFALEKISNYVILLGIYNVIFGILSYLGLSYSKNKPR